MKRTAVALIKLSLGGLLCVLLFAGSPSSFPDNPLPQSAGRAKKDIAVRNLTDRPVRFTVQASPISPDLLEKTLPPGTLQRFTEGSSLTLTFEREGRSVTYSLEPGKAYSFRYDEDGLLELYDGSHGRTDVPDLAPFVATPMAVVEKMLEMAGVTDQDIVYDLGCGDGRIVILAARKYGARGVGIDIDPRRIEESRALARTVGVEDRVTFLLGDAAKADISPATVVTLYLLPESNALLRPVLEEQLRPGTRVVSHNYHMPGWEDREIGYTALTTGDGELHTIFVYRR